MAALLAVVGAVVTVRSIGFLRGRRLRLTEVDYAAAAVVEPSRPACVGVTHRGPSGRRPQGWRPARRAPVRKARASDRRPSDRRTQGWRLSGGRPRDPRPAGGGIVFDQQDHRHGVVHGTTAVLPLRMAILQRRAGRWPARCRPPARRCGHSPICEDRRKAWYIALRVAPLTTPVSATPSARWKVRVARTVFVPKTPSETSRP